MTVGSRNIRDLVVLVADKDMEQAVLKLLTRAASLGISNVTYNVFTHPRHDPGCRTASCEVLTRSLASQYRFALVLFDYEGSGDEKTAPDQLAQQVEAQLASCGWEHRCRAVILAPELEIWVWTDSSELDRVIGWAGRQPVVREWLRDQGFTLQTSGKPDRPKEALRAALRHVRKQPSAALFAALASSVSLSRCVDPAFLKLKSVLQHWFPS